MTRDRTHEVALVGVLFLLLLVGVASRAMADEDDPPSRVARLAYVQGSVSFQPAGTDDWVMAGLNRPVTTGDKLWADRDARVELQLDGSLIRASDNTGFSFLNLSDTVTQIQLTAGTMLVRVQRLDDHDTYEVDTPNLAFSVLRPGLYRISVNEAGDSTAIKIRNGEGDVTGGGAAYTVHANDSATFSGTDQLRASSDPYGSDQDPFESWAAERDRRWENSNSARYVSADVVGYEDLDEYGSWRRTPDQGNVWFPRTSDPGWAPYHAGHWAYIEPWGYTWVDDAPWGFAPFHYGRWVSYEGAWGWVPAPPRAAGVVYVRPVYAPALVAWVGGPRFGISMGIGGARYAPGVNVGWFPLGPREVYVPSYRVSRNYVNNVNVSNTTVNTTVVNNYYNATVVNNRVNATNTYVNQRVAGAVTATTPEAFTAAQPVGRHAVRVDPREVASAPVRALTPAVVPAKQGVLGTQAAVAKPPAVLETRGVVAKAAPPPPPPSFEQRQDAIKHNGGKPLSATQVREIEPVAARREAPVRMAPPATPRVPPQAAPTAGRGTVESPNRPADRPIERPANPNNAAQPAPINRPAAAPDAPPPIAPAAPRSSDRPADRPVSGNANPAANTPPPPNTAQPSDRRGDRPTERPASPNNAAQPAPVNRPTPPPVVHPSEMPALPKPVVPPSASPVVDRKQQQQQDQLRAKQEQERRNVQQQQEQQHAKLAQQQADEAKKQQIEQQHQRQTQQLQQKQADAQKRLAEQQQQERQAQSKTQKKGDRPPEGKP